MSVMISMRCVAAAAAHRQTACSQRQTDRQTDRHTHTDTAAAAAVVESAAVVVSKKHQRRIYFSAGRPPHLTPALLATGYCCCCCCDCNSSIFTAVRRRRRLTARRDRQSGRSMRSTETAGLDSDRGRIMHSGAVCLLTLQISSLFNQKKTINRSIMYF